MKGSGGKGEKKAPDSIKVFLRVRPPMGREIHEAHSCKNLSYDAADDRIVKIRDLRHGTEEAVVEKRFAFHRVFSPASTQEQVYDAFAREAVDDALQGYHGVMFVYGQTGSGKTFTISNDEAGKEGMLQRSMKAVWDKVKSDKEFDYECSVSYVQLYNEMLTDMLEPNPELNAVRLSGVADRRNDVVMVNDATSKPIAREVRSYADTLNMFKSGVSRRVESRTEMNSVSSRSHTVFTLYIKKQARNESSAAMADGGTPTALEGRLVICDLAGSERIKKTDVKGTQLAEANHINGSLLVLGRVVAALTDPKQAQHVPYRESKLTRILQYSLSGWGKTRLVVNVSPSDDNTDETLGAIQFGQRAIQIKQAAEKHETVDFKALYVDLQRQMDKQRDTILRDLMIEFNAEKVAAVADYEDRVKLLESEVSLLRLEIAQKDELIVQLQSGVPAAAAGDEVGVTPQRQPPSSAVVATPQQSVTAGVSNSSMALSPNGSTIVEGALVPEILSKMKAVMNNREERLKELNGHVHDLKEQLAVYESRLLLVANRLRDQLSVGRREKMYYEKCIAELNEKLSNVQGVDFLNANATVAEDDHDAHGATSPARLSTPPLSSDAGTSQSGAVSADDNSDRLWRAIHVLQSKLNESHAYNRTARRAIQLLAHDLDQARVTGKAQ